ncbi:MAG: nucleotidyltransferase family protein [Planctomycetes bacterium]|nr:nucleotidyltransferase family protein [Planctomycetota bacterium]
MRTLVVGPADARAVLSANLRNLEALSTLLSRFNQDGIWHALFKGAAFLATIYADDPGSRPMGDLDVLVLPGDLGRAEETLADLGYQVCPNRGREFLLPGGPRIDLQSDLWHLPPREVEIFRSRCVPARVGPVATRVPEASEHFLLVLVHAAIRHATVRPTWVEDIRRLIESHGPAIDWSRILAGVRRVRGEVPVSLFLEQIAANCPLPVPGSFVRALGPPSRRPLLAKVYRRLLARSELLYAGELLTHLFHLPRERLPGDLLRFVLPDSETLARRYGPGHPAALQARRVLSLALRSVAAAGRLFGCGACRVKPARGP